MSTDPLISHPGSTQSINPYSYVANNPLNKTDPTGMCTGMYICHDGSGGGVGFGGYDTKVTLKYTNGKTVHTTLGHLMGKNLKQVDQMGSVAKNSNGDTSVAQHKVDAKPDSGAGLPSGGFVAQSYETYSGRTANGNPKLTHISPAPTLDPSLRPKLAAIADNPIVKKAIAKAWSESNPNEPPNLGKAGPEHGFWILRNNKTGGYMIKWWPHFPEKGQEFYKIAPGKTPHVKGYTTIVAFHTHPAGLKSGRSIGPDG